MCVCVCVCVWRMKCAFVAIFRQWIIDAKRVVAVLCHIGVRHTELYGAGRSACCPATLGRLRLKWNEPHWVTAPGIPPVITSNHAAHAFTTSAIAAARRAVTRFVPEDIRERLWDSSCCMYLNTHTHTHTHTHAHI